MLSTTKILYLMKSCVSLKNTVSCKTQSKQMRFKRWTKFWKTHKTNLLFTIKLNTAHKSNPIDHLSGQGIYPNPILDWCTITHDKFRMRLARMNFQEQTYSYMTKARIQCYPIDCVWLNNKFVLLEHDRLFSDGRHL